jgi:hypothetical protein
VEPQIILRWYSLSLVFTGWAMWFCVCPPSSSCFWLWLYIRLCSKVRLISLLHGYEKRKWEKNNIPQNNSPMVVVVVVVEKRSKGSSKLAKKSSVGRMWVFFSHTGTNQTKIH